MVVSAFTTAFMVSVFGEATRTSLRAPRDEPRRRPSDTSMSTKQSMRKVPVLSGYGAVTCIQLGSASSTTLLNLCTQLFVSNTCGTCRIAFELCSFADKVPSNLPLQLDVVEQYELRTLSRTPRRRDPLLQAGLTSHEGINSHRTTQPAGCCST
jgi:hypothetical protein